MPANAPSVLSLVNEELEKGIKENEQSKNILLIAKYLEQEKKNITINGKPLDVLLSQVKARSAQIGMPETVLINKLIIVMKTELGIELALVDERQDMSFATENLLRIFTQRGFTHIANNLLTNSLNAMQIIPMDNTVKIDIKKQTNLELSNPITTGLVITNTSSVYQANNLEEEVILEKSEPLITCKSEVTLPVLAGRLESRFQPQLQSKETMLIVDNISISSTCSTFADEHIQSLSTALNKVNAQMKEAQNNPDLNMSDATLLQVKILDVKTKLEQPHFLSIFKKSNVHEIEALDKALSYLKKPTAESLQELKDLKGTIKSKRICDILEKVETVGKESEKLIQNKSPT